MFFFPREGVQCDEAWLLRNLEGTWHANAHTFRQVLGPMYEIEAHVLFSWVSERFKMLQLKYLMDSQAALPPSEMVDRLLAMNDLRMMRFKWRAMKVEEGNNMLSAEDLLCRAFALMTKTEGTEAMFKQGLERLNESVFGFLKTEDMKISMVKQR
jgi:hypothetical protein